MFITLDKKLTIMARQSSYRKIPTISPGLIFAQKAFSLGLFSGELIFRGAYYWKEFCVSKWVGLDNKNSLKYYENSLKQLALTIHGQIFRSAYYRKDFCVRDLGSSFSVGLIYLLFFFGGGGGGGGWGVEAYFRNFTVS